MIGNLVLESERLLLREFRDGDFGAVHRYGSDPLVVRYLPWGPNTEDETRAFLTRAQASAAAIPRVGYELAAVIKEGDRLVGGIGLHKEGPNAMLGYCYDRSAWGKGIATEAAHLLVDFGFRSLELHRVWAGCDPENLPSARVLQKLGMRLEGHLRENNLIRGEWRDTLIFAVLDSEWR